jgi:hypothetical protein
VPAADPLRAVAALGPFFRIETGVAGPGWLPLADLRTRLDPLVEDARAGFAATRRVDPDQVQPRAFATVHHLGVLARLVSAPLATAALHGVAPDLTGARFRIEGTAVHFGVDEPNYRPAGELAATLDAAAAILEADYRARFGLSRKALRGNLDSAVVGAATVLTTARPERQADVARVLRSVVGIDSPREFRRASCCLLYRLPGGAVCGDCVLTSRGSRGRRHLPSVDGARHQP